MINRTIYLLLLLILFTIQVNGQNDSQICIGKKYFIESDILNEKREYWVYLPADYEVSKYEYPVLYLLDGQEHFHQVTGLVNHMSRLVQRMPRMIVVGVVSTEQDRVRDYTPNEIDILPNGGGASLFTDFFEKELFVEINSQFRTANYKLLFGHSLAGVYVDHIFTKRNELFDVYFAADPAIFVDKSVGREFKAFMADVDTIRSSYYLSLCGDVDSTTIVPNVEVYDFIKTKCSEKLNWDYKFYPDEDHVSMTLKAIYDGLETLFSGYSIPKSYLHAYDLKKIIDHIMACEEQYNFHIALPEQLINEYAMHFWSAQKYDDALELLQLNIDNYNDPFETFYFMGRTHLLTGDEKMALHFFKKSLAIKEVWDVRDKIDQITSQ